jgi:hypothetical protein
MIGAPSAARSAAVSSGLAVLGLLALLGGAWQLTAVPGQHETSWAELTVLAIISGFVALGWLRSARVGMTAPQVMLLLGALGMVGGLAYDARSGGFAEAAALCRAGSGDFVGTMRLHWQQLPGMHLGMIFGGLATVPLLRRLRQGCRRQFCARLVQNLACSAWMVLGMTAGTLAFTNLTARDSVDPNAMLGGMFGGMVWGMVASVSAYRLWFRVLDHISNLRDRPGA